MKINRNLLIYGMIIPLSSFLIITFIFLIPQIGNIGGKITLGVPLKFYTVSSVMMSSFNVLNLFFDLLIFELIGFGIYYYKKYKHNLIVKQTSPLLIVISIILIVLCLLFFLKVYGMHNSDLNSQKSENICNNNGGICVLKEDCDKSTSIVLSDCKDNKVCCKNLSYLY